MKPPLTINKYFFPYVEVAADPEFNPHEQEKQRASIETKVSLETIKEKDLYQVMLEITLFPEDEKRKVPYSIRLVAVGLFNVDPNVKDPEKLLEINGASILYSSAREFLITITSRGPWSPIFLPTISFIPQSPSQERNKVTNTADETNKRKKTKSANTKEAKKRKIGE